MPKSTAHRCAHVVAGDVEYPDRQVVEQRERMGGRIAPMVTYSSSGFARRNSTTRSRFGWGAPRRYIGTLESTKITPALYVRQHLVDFARRIAVS